MNSSDLIDAAALHYLNKGAESVGDSDTRARVLFHAQTAAKRRWNKRPWWFKGASATVEVDDSGGGDLPADFSSFGKDGFLMNPAAKGAPLVWLPPNRLLKMRELRTGTSQTPRFYTLHGRVLVEEEGVIGGLQVYPKPPTDVSLTMYYDMRAPVLAEEPEDPDDPSTDELWKFPADFHESVLLKDTIARLQFDEGDSRSLETKQEADQADAELWAEHGQGRHQKRGSPRYGQGTFR